MFKSNPLGPSGVRGEARVSLSSNNPALEIRVLDSQFQVAAEGTGSLHKSVDPGLYEIQCRVGSNIARELVRLDEGDFFTRENLSVEFPTAAPVDLSGQIAGMSVKALGARSAVGLDVASSFFATTAGINLSTRERLVVFLRRITDAEAPDTAAEFGPLSIINAKGEECSPLDPEMATQDYLHNEWAATVLSLEPGGYTLRRRIRSKEKPSVPQRETLDQALWVEPGWQTFVFIPSVGGTLAPQAASIHMIPTGVQWNLTSPENLALESLYAGLREGRALTLTDTSLLTQQPPSNLMLPIVGAAAALLAPEPDLELLEQIVRTLKATETGVPDIRALDAIVQERRIADNQRKTGNEYFPPDVGPVRWPPMLSQLYQGLLRVDSRWPEVECVVDGSAAELAAVKLLIGGLWSAWEPLSTQATMDTMVRLKQFLKDRVAATDSEENLEVFVSQIDAGGISDATGIPIAIVNPVLPQAKERFMQMMRNMEIG